MTVDLNEIPTIKAELERKAIEFLTFAAQRTDTGRMNACDLALVGKTLWSVTSGLVDDDVSKLCAQAAESDKARLMRRHFIGKGEVLTVAWMGDGVGYVVISRNATTKTRTILRQSKTEIGLREEEMKKLFAGLAKTGYVEL